jgi:hypothetical protein
VTLNCPILKSSANTIHCRYCLTSHYRCHTSSSPPVQITPSINTWQRYGLRLQPCLTNQSLLPLAPSQLHLTPNGISVRILFYTFHHFLNGLLSFAFCTTRLPCSWSRMFVLNLQSAKHIQPILSLKYLSGVAFDSKNVMYCFFFGHIRLLTSTISYYRSLNSV